MIYLHRILPIFVLPVGITLVVVLSGLLLRRRALIVAGVIVLWLSSTPLVSALAIRAAEGFAERGPASDAPEADAIIVLGGGGRIVAPGKAAVSQWNDAERFFGGLELFRAGKSPLLVFTRGVSPLERGSALEGDILAAYADSMGVPATQIAETTPASNTAEEAQAAAALLRGRLPGSSQRGGGAPRILLVTSAFHMPRARLLFERAGMRVIPFPVDFALSASRTMSVLDFMPTGAALQQTETAMREGYGRLFYFVVR